MSETNTEPCARCGATVSYERTTEDDFPEYEVCQGCGYHFCPDCIDWEDPSSGDYCPACSTED